MRTLAFLLLAHSAFAESSHGLSWTPPKNWKILPPNPGCVATYDVGGVQLEVSYVDGTDIRGAVAALKAALPDPKASFRPERLNNHQVIAVEAHAKGNELVGVILVHWTVDKQNEGMLVFKMLGPKKIVERARAEQKNMLFAITQTSAPSSEKTGE